MIEADIRKMFEAKDGNYRFARWGRAIAPVAFGVEDEALGVIKGALDAVTQLAGHETTDMDPELGSNCMFFFFADWDELLDVPKLDQLVPELDSLVDRVKVADASQYRLFRFDKAGAIQACFVFMRIAGAQADVPAQELALGQAVQIILLWGDQAFAQSSPLARTPEGVVVLKPEVADLIRAAYDPVMPVAAEDAVHALRLAARVQARANA